MTVDDGLLLTVVVVVVVDVDVGRLMCIVVDVEGGFVGLWFVVVLVPSVGREDGLKLVVVFFGGVVRVGVVEVGSENVVPSWTDWNVCNLMFCSVVVAGKLVNNEFLIVVVAAGINAGNLSMMCCSELDSVLLSVLSNDVIGTYFTVVVSNLVELKPLVLLLLLIGV